MICQTTHKFDQLTTNLLIAIKENEMESDFKTYTPSPKTGYAFDQSSLMCKLKELTKKDGHCPASWTICCQRAKSALNNH